MANSDPLQQLVVLTVAQHVEAHRLLSLCTSGRLKEALDFAYDRMKKYGFDGSELAKDRYNRRKLVHRIAKALRKETKYKKSWEQCLEEASMLVNKPL